MDKTFSLSVSELTHTIRFILEDSFDSIRVTGEISNFKHHSSGHRYFTLKDDGAQIACTMWRGRNIDFLPGDGMKVSVFGNLTLYPPQGKYQIDCISMMPLGQGDLYLAFEALKRKLHAEGYFDEVRKRPLPVLPSRIGVITSPTGAAIRDILSTLARRMPAAAVYFRPALVQGEGAGEDLAAALAELNETDCDVIIIGRGGGSIEDLWAFNTEVLAEAIFNSEIPVVSAVGHEVDFTIADYVADLRAATPTAAAELVTPRSMNELLAHVLTIEEFLPKKMQDIVGEHLSFVGDIAESSVFRRFGEKIYLYEQELDEAETRMEQALRKLVANAKRELGSMEAHCNSLHPLNPLRKGFALLRTNGKILSKDESLSAYDSIEILRESESAEAKILSVDTKKTVFLPNEQPL